MNNKKSFYELSIDEKKEIFVRNLVPTNRAFNFYVNWKNAEAYKELEVELNSLNVLIRVKEEEFKNKFGSKHNLSDDDSLFLDKIIGYSWGYRLV